MRRLRNWFVNQAIRFLNFIASQSDDYEVSVVGKHCPQCQSDKVAAVTGNSALYRCYNCGHEFATKN